MVRSTLSLTTNQSILLLYYLYTVGPTHCRVISYTHHIPTCISFVWFVLSHSHTMSPLSLLSARWIIYGVYLMLVLVQQQTQFAPPNHNRISWLHFSSSLRSIIGHKINARRRLPFRPAIHHHRCFRNQPNKFKFEIVRIHRLHQLGKHTALLI